MARFEKGNTASVGKGRPKGSGRISKLIEELDSDLPEIRKKVVQMAKEGDLAAVKLIWDRVYPISTSQLLQLEAQMEQIRALVGTMK